MALLLFSNNASTTLAAPITPTSAAITITGGSGALFPFPTGAQYFTATIVKAGSPSVFEIVRCSNAGTDTYTLARAQESTTAQSWNAGDTFSLFPTAGDMAHLVQLDDLQAQLGNFAIDVGAANAYVVALSPALTAHVRGMPIRWLATHANTGVSTFNDGVGSAALQITPGAGLPAGIIQSGGIYTATWDGFQFQLGATVNLTGYLTAGVAATTYAPLVSPLFTGTPSGPTAATNTRNTEFATTQFANPGGAPFATNGWRENPDGTIDQWGLNSFTNGGSSISFPTPFPNACLNAVGNPYGANANVVVVSWTASTLTMTNFINGQNSWRAIGY